MIKYLKALLYILYIPWALFWVTLACLFLILLTLVEEDNDFKNIK